MYRRSRIPKTRPISIILLFILTLSPPCYSKYKRIKETLYLDSRELLQIVFYPSVNPMMELNESNMADTMKEEQDDFFRKAIYPLLEIAQLPIDVQLFKAGDRVSKNDPILKVHIMRWEDAHGYGELEAVVEVWLYSNKLKQRIGIYKNKELMKLGSMEKLREEAYIKSMFTTLTPLMTDLLENLSEPPADEHSN